LAVCPKCQNKLKEDFGLETCKKCGEVVFINMDDSVSLQELHQEIQQEEEISSLESSEINDEIFNSNTTETVDLNEEVIQIEDPFAVNTIEDDIVGGFELETVDPMEDVASPVSEPPLLPTEEYEFASEESEVSEFDIPEVAQPVQVSNVQTSAEDFLEEMQSFGEMDSEKFKEGIYFFDIEISNIDSKDTREQILNELEDSKLNLQIENINKRIVKGVLLLPAIPAVKAHVIVQKISHLACDISWKLLEVQDLSVETEIELEDSLDNDVLTESDEFS
jgi:hypothetical protein